MNLKNISPILLALVISAGLRADAQVTTQTAGADAIADGAITTAKLANGAVTTQKLDTSAVTSSKLDDDAVTSRAILENAVTTGKLSTDSVTAAKISGGAVTTSKIHVEALDPGGDLLLKASGGNVGIGTPSPQSVLHINFSGNPSFTIERTDTTVNTGNDIGNINFRGGELTIGDVGRIQVEADETWTDTESGTRMKFYTTNQGTLDIAERMRIDSLGNIGIGTGSPSGRLHVVGGALRVGIGSTPDVTPGTDDVFIEGTLEVDGASRFDGTITGTGLVCTDCIDTADIADSQVTTSKLADGSVTTAKLSGGGGIVTSGAALCLLSTGAIGQCTTSDASACTCE